MPGGRPSKYKPEHCKAIVDFFDESKPLSKPLFMVDFAESINVSRDLLLKWTKKYPEFLLSYKRAKDKMINRIICGGLTGVYNSGVACFTLKNIAGWRDRQEVEHVGQELKLINIVQNADTERKHNDRVNGKTDRSASLSDR